MPTITVQYTETLTTITCGKCGIPFAVPDNWRQKRMEDHETFYCPNGHPRAFTGKSDAQQLRDELARTKAQLDQRDARIVTLRDTVAQSERRINGYKGVTTRLKRRIQAGRCPCCSAEFKDLGRHMKNQHPEWNPDKHAEALAEKGSK